MLKCIRDNVAWGNMLIFLINLCEDTQSVEEITESVIYPFSDD